MNSKKESKLYISLLVVFIIVFLLGINVFNSYKINQLQRDNIKLTQLIMNNSQMIYNNIKSDEKRKNRIFTLELKSPE